MFFYTEHISGTKTIKHFLLIEEAACVHLASVKIYMENQQNKTTLP